MSVQLEDPNKGLDYLDIYERAIEHGRIELSDSTIMSFDSCPRKFEFAKLFRTARDDMSIAGELGNALHRAFQLWQVQGDRDRAILELCIYYPWHLCSNRHDPKGLPAAIETLEAMMDRLDDDYELAYIEVDGEARPAIEVPFELVIEGIEFAPGVPFVYRGYIDSVLYALREQIYVVDDVKTTSMSIKDSTPKYAFRDQCVPYQIAISAVTDQDITNLKVRYFEAKVDILEPRIRKLDFYKSADDVLEFMRKLAWTCQQIKTWGETMSFPRHGQSCVAFNKPCKFFEICHSSSRQELKTYANNARREQEIHDRENKKPFAREGWNPWVSISIDISEFLPHG